MPSTITNNHTCAPDIDEWTLQNDIFTAFTVTEVGTADIKSHVTEGTMGNELPSVCHPAGGVCSVLCPVP